MPQNNKDSLQEVSNAGIAFIEAHKPEQLFINGTYHPKPPAETHPAHDISKQFIEEVRSSMPEGWSGTMLPTAIQTIFRRARRELGYNLTPMGDIIIIEKPLADAALG